jgi:hypothetical protein
MPHRLSVIGDTASFCTPRGGEYLAAGLLHLAAGLLHLAAVLLLVDAAPRER